MKKRTALVTGGSQGIGLAIARRLAEAGCDLMLTDIAGAEGEGAVAEEIAAELGCKVLYHSADLAVADEVDGLAVAARQTFGAVDILVNNAAAPRRPVLVPDTGIDEWRQTISVNLDAPFLLSKAFLPDMLEREWGRIVNVSSVFGLVGTAKRAGYVATKHALIGLTRAIAAETRDTGVTCNAVCPGLTMTPRQERDIQAISKEQNITFDEAEGILARRLVAERFLRADSTAAAVAYLCSDAAGDTSGAALPVDGGQSAVR